MIRSFRPALNVLPVLLLGILSSIMLGTHDALAQDQNLTGMSQSIGSNIAVIPKTISVIAYVIATFYAATGLVKLKDWISEPAKNPLNAALFRIAVASMLIVFPHVLVIVNTVFFGQGSNGTRSVDVAVPVHELNAFK